MIESHPHDIQITRESPTTTRPSTTPSNKMSNPYTRDQIENFAGDFCQTDIIRRFTPNIREIADEILVTFLAAPASRGH